MCAGFAENFNPQSEELKSYGRFLGGGPSTTADLAERCFAHLQAVSKMHSKAKGFSALSKWFYANTNPYTHGLPMLRTTLADYEATNGAFEGLLTTVTKRSFNMATNYSLLITENRTIPQ